MRVAVCFPSANPARAVTAVARWQFQGYEAHVWVEGDAFPDPGAAFLHRADSYPGYWRAVNFLAQRAVNDGADIVVVVGDDMDPDPTRKAEAIGVEYATRFPDGFGVMNPVGDHLDGTDRVCGCPWLGRGWVERAYRGRGSYWPGYGHFFGDTELQIIAQRHGVLWQRDDVAQFHHHWSRGEPIQPYQQAAIRTWWHADLELFTQRRDADFPDAEPALPRAL